jgi:hypothetical protein
VDEDPGRERDESPVAEIARGVGNAAMFVPEIQGAVQGVTLAVLAVVFVPLGLGILVLSAILYVVIFAGLVHLPAGGLMSALGFGWWILTLVLMFLAFRRLYRWLGSRSSRLRKVVDFGFSAPDRGGEGPAPDTARITAARVEHSPGGSAVEPPMTLAELDARLAPTGDAENKPS